MQTKTVAPTGAAVFLRGQSSGRGSAPALLRRPSILPKAKSRRRADSLRPRILKNRGPRQRVRWWGGTAPLWPGEGNRRRQGYGRGIMQTKTVAPTGAAVFLRGQSSGRGSAPALLRRPSILPKAKSRRRADSLRPRILKNRGPRQRVRWWGGTAPLWPGEGNRRRQGYG